MARSEQQPLSEVTDEILEVLVPAGHARALILKRGQLLEIVDVEGQQVADFIAFSEQDRHEWLSTSHTRSATLFLNLRIGDRLQSNWRNPMFEVLADDVGMHDVITQMCDSQRYRIDYGVENHRSCRSNFLEAFAPWGVQAWEFPDPFNIFQNAPIKSDRSFGNQVPTSKAGDRIVLRVLMDAIIGVSACPQDLNPCNGFRPTPILIRVCQG